QASPETQAAQLICRGRRVASIHRPPTPPALQERRSANWRRQPLGGHPAEIIRRQRGKRGGAETAASFRRRHGRGGAAPAGGESPAIIGGIGKIAPRRYRRIERCGFDRIGVGELRDRDLARGGVATFGSAIQLFCQLLHRLVLPPVSQPAFYRRDVCRGG